MGSNTIKARTRKAATILMMKTISPLTPFFLSSNCLISSTVKLTFRLYKLFLFFCGYVSMIPYSGKLLREKTFVNFSFVAISCEIWGVVSFGVAQVSNLQKFSSRKSSFHHIVKVFSLKSFPLYGVYNVNFLLV